MKIKWKKFVDKRTGDDFVHIGKYGNFEINIGYYCTVISHKSSFPCDGENPNEFKTVCVIEDTSRQKDIKRDKADAEKKLREIIISLRDEMTRYAKDIECQ